jgi:modulator of FtsH protease
VVEILSSSAYDPIPWQGFAIAEVGAAAALAGLLVVAASINIRSIIEAPAVVSRLAATLTLFASILFIGTVLLIPDQSRTLLGIEIAVIGAAVAVTVWSERGVDEVEPEYRRHAMTAAIIALVAAVLIAFSGIALAGMFAGGLYWLVPGVLLALGIGLVNAWVTLIEILR